MRGIVRNVDKSHESELAGSGDVNTLMRRVKRSWNTWIYRLQEIRADTVCFA